MKLAALFLWLTLPIAGYAAYASEGLPHMILSYSFKNNGDPYDPFKDRYYTSCTYWGAYGFITVPAPFGRCPLVRFFKEEDAQ